MLAGCGGGTAPTTAKVGEPCRGAVPPRRYDHVVLVVLENHSFSEIAGHSPYLNGLARACGLATDYHAVSYPSLPNYLALTSGSTQGISSDCTSCAVSSASIFGQLDGDWHAYMEDLPSTGFRGAFSNQYAKKHNPAAYFTQIAGAYASRAVGLGSLSRDLARGALAKFGIVSPDLCNDEHDCPVEAGDRWLQTWLPRLLGSPEYRAGRTAVFVTYDEGIGSDNQVYTVVAARSVRPGMVVSARFDHYSLLRTAEQLLGLPCLANACGARSMAAPFALRSGRA